MTYLPQLKDELVRSGRRLDGRRGVRRWRAGALGVFAVMTVTGVAYAAGARPLGLGPSVGQDGRVLPASVQVLPLRVPDPVGGPPWGLRVFRTTRGSGCVAAGRVAGGQLGTVDRKGRFHATPVGSAAPCSGSPHHALRPARGGVYGLTVSGTVPASGASLSPLAGDCVLPGQHDGLPAFIASLRARLRAAQRAGDDQRAARARGELATARRIAGKPRCRRSELRTIHYGVPGGIGSAYLRVEPAPRTPGHR